MTRSKEYQEADVFKRYLLRQIYAGNALIKSGWYEHQKDKANLVYLPLDTDTLVAVKNEYDRIKKRNGGAL